MPLEGPTIDDVLATKQAIGPDTTISVPAAVTAEAATAASIGSPEPGANAAAMHVRVECSECGITIRNCRCSHQDKRVDFEICPVCATRKPVTMDLASVNVHKTSSVQRYVGGYSIDDDPGGKTTPVAKKLARLYARRPELKKQPAALMVVADSSGNLLSVSRPEPPYEMSLPGGHVDAGETAAQAAARELGARRERGGDARSGRVQ